MTANYLCVGDPGAGKTVSILKALLEHTNKRVWVADFDANAGLVKPIITRGWDRLTIKPFRDKLRRVKIDVWTSDGRNRSKSQQQAFDIEGNGCIWQFASWVDGIEWTPNDVLIIDTGTKMAEACIRASQKEAGRGGHPLRLQDWSAPQDKELKIIQTAQQLECSTIIIYHLKRRHLATVVDGDADYVVATETGPRDRKGKEIDSALTKTLWPTGVGDKGPVNVVNEHAMCMGFRRHGEGSRLILNATSEIACVKMPLDIKQKESLEQLPAEEAFASIFNIFSGD